MSEIKEEEKPRGAKWMNGLKLEDIEPAEKPTGHSNLIELNAKEKKEIMEMLRLRKPFHEIKKEWKRGTLSASIGQIKQIDREWKEKIAELTLPEEAPEEEVIE